MIAIRFLSVLALIAVAFAHKPLDLSPPAPYLLAQYALPDGTYPVICITDADTSSQNHDHDDGSSHDGHDRHVAGNGCEACRISSSFLCPAPAPTPGAAPHIAMTGLAATPQPIMRRNAYPPSAPPQAPPSYI